MIAKAIIFRRLESEIPKQPWYEGGYRANVVTYAMAKVFHDASRTSEVLDLDTIAKRQMVSDDLAGALLIAAEKAHEVITHPVAGMRNFSEWAKQQACWSELQGLKIDYGRGFERCLTLRDTAKKNEHDAKESQRELVGIQSQVQVVKLGADFWRGLLDQGRATGSLTTKDAEILRICTSMPRLLPTDKQARHALMLLDRLKADCPGLEGD
jgi:hypothetical protein